MTRRIAVIGDLHANIRALEAALAVVDRDGADEVVLLGDVLSYGVDVEAVTVCVADLCSRGKTTLLRGNHDAMYLSAERLDTLAYEDRLPEWLRETIAFTRSRLPVDAFDRLPFADSYCSAGVLFAHANPFGRGDWRYLNSAADHLAACAILKDQGLLAGVFGHTHRAKVFSAAHSVFLDIDRSLVLTAADGPFVLNAGSVGQPRSSVSSAVHVLFLEVREGVVSARFQPFEYDMSGHIASIKACGMSDATVEKLVSFFAVPPRSSLLRV